MKAKAEPLINTRSEELYSIVVANLSAFCHEPVSSELIAKVARQIVEDLEHAFIFA